MTDHAQLAAARAKARVSVKNTDTETAKALSSLDPDQRAKVARRLAEIPPKYRPAYLRAVTSQSRNAAIRAFCNECMGFEGLPESVRSCTAPACPLYRHRPGAKR